MTTKSISPNESEERAAGFVLYRDDPASSQRLFLILRHRRGEHWAFPKGRIEPGETLMEAARRELQEETGISSVAIIDGFREESRYSFRRAGQVIKKSVAYFLARVESGVVRLSSEHTDSAWLPEDDAANRLTFAEARRILGAAQLAAGRESKGTTVV